MVPVPEPPYLFPEVETIDQRQPEDNGVIDPAATPRVRFRTRPHGGRRAATVRPMPLRAHHLPPRSTAPLDRPNRSRLSPFDDLVYLLAAGVADAQTALDAHAAETLTSRSRRPDRCRPDADSYHRVGRDSHDGHRGDGAPILLELGLTPARYRFSDATIEVEVDVVSRNATSPTRPTGGQARGSGVRPPSGHAVRDRPANVRPRGRRERSARGALEPTPMPAAVGPEDASETSPASDGGEHAN